MATTVKRQLKQSSAPKKATTPRKKRGILRIVFAPFAVLRFLVPKYFRNAWGELRQVNWPNRKETFKLTIAVFTFAIVFGVFITVADYGLDKLFKQILLK